ncbi:MAG: haloacid dehalogenase-like hydrolase [Clostridiaceae bacterium]|nr:haloacid dehalogenase-like hydrolase [Clostridiaceae bacterium]NBI82001.1 haloacid dehalogenase-like hydrolase [Clostridiaceae bacterium]
MVKRLLSCTAGEMLAMGKADVLQAIAGSEGRVLACETIGAVQPLLGDLTNAEFAASQGADILLLNLFDVRAPRIEALPPCAPGEAIRELKRLTGRLVGINLEPVDPEGAAVEADAMWSMTAGRLATPENARLAAEMGVDWIVLTGNPGMGVSNRAILSSLRELRAALGDRVILAAGKMHASGMAGDCLLSLTDVEAFAQAGADIILLPAPGTVPGVTVEAVRERIVRIHALGKLAMTAIGTSQEGADTDTIRRIALACKMAGADVHHIGDTGYGGMALPENIRAYSVAIRGIRHTYHRMASSVNR